MRRARWLQVCGAATAAIAMLSLFLIFDEETSGPSLSPAIEHTEAPEAPEATLHPEREPQDVSDLEEPTIDGPEPMTPEDFVRDSQPDSNTARQPLQPIGEPDDSGDTSTAERTE